MATWVGCYGFLNRPWAMSERGGLYRNFQGKFRVMKKRRLFDEKRQMNQSARPMQLIRILLALLVVVTTARGAEPEPVPQRVMTLVDCIQAALE